MTTLETVALWGALLSLAALAVGGLRFHLRFLDRLKNAHPQEWSALGSPEMCNGEGSRAESSLAAYILLDKYSTLGDPVLNANGKAMRFCYLLSVVCLGILFFALRNQ
jgi:hypothetical protein